MSDQGPTFIWKEQSEGIVIELPAPPDEQLNKRGAMMFLIIALIITVPLLGLIVGSAILAAPADPIAWAVVVLGVTLEAWTVKHFVAKVHNAPVEPIRAAPSLLTVSDGILKIERTGERRDIDVSWELSEIADIRLCPAAPDGPFLSRRAVVKAALSADEIVRISVMLPSGQVEDVKVMTKGRYWTDALEERLRKYLDLDQPPGNATGMQ